MMNVEGVLRRLSSLEADPYPWRSFCPVEALKELEWLVSTARGLALQLKEREDRLRKLGAVVEAARGLIEEVKAPNYGVEREGSSIAFWERLDVLEEALAALEEGG